MAAILGTLVIYWMFFYHQKVTQTHANSHPTTTLTISVTKENRNAKHTSFIGASSTSSHPPTVLRLLPSATSYDY
ncbi:hypothetical protein BJV74DRAFT_851190 [Russula compacta]|nr:hypothetical protein BJV74DRAFT_851190 [Russula compacta]